MITLIDVPEDYTPEWSRTYSIRGDEVRIDMQYKGPLPQVNKPLKLEVTYFKAHFGDEYQMGRIDWDPANGPFTYRAMGSAIAMLWDIDTKSLRVLPSRGIPIDMS